jgi:hypothetical protein
VINFQGAFKGKLVFNNVVFVFKYKYDDNWNRDTLEYGIRSGSFYVESNGQKVYLPNSSFGNFLYPNSDNDHYGDEPINIILPAVPNAPNGNLSERDGNNEQVNDNNVIAFFATFVEEFENPYNAPRSVRAVNEYKFSYENLEHGSASGYLLYKESGSGQYNNNEDREVYAGTMEYNDYSNVERLYFGGGYGIVVDYPDNTRKATINGKVKFNGEFAGELDFQNFKYERTYNSNYEYEYKFVSGNVFIGGINVTDLYFEVVKSFEY